MPFRSSRYQCPRGDQLRSRRASDAAVPPVQSQTMGFDRMVLNIAAIQASASHAGDAVTQVQASGQSTPKTADIDSRVERFRQIFNDAVEAEKAARGTTAAEQQGITATERQRTIDTLGLDATAAEGLRTGDTILNGLSKLRSVFDAQQARIADVISADAAGGTAATSASLMAAQFEVVQYTMLVDVTSKLTGKATQSFDTLMKGQ